jgi:NADPH-dependent curcumin reductase CurA
MITFLSNFEDVESQEDFVEKTCDIGFQESDMYLRTGSIKLKVPEGSKAVLVKNFYLSRDPLMQFFTSKVQGPDAYDYYTPWLCKSV